MPPSTLLSPLLWQPRDVGSWLTSLNLESYTPRFEWHKIDGECLLKLTQRDLQLLEIESCDKTHLQNQIELLRENFNFSNRSCST
jgi:hypothetical protein